MSPLGKFTLAILGLRFAGATGFLWGFILGHLFIDNTKIIKIIESAVSQLNDNIRLLLPYNVYNKIEGHFWGKIWGAVFGYVLFGWYGFLILFVLGHFLFDTPYSKHANKFRNMIDKFVDDNLGKISGGIIGFSFQSNVLLFAGVVLGFFLDIKSFRDALSMFKFSSLRVHRKGTYIINMAALSAKLTNFDGKANEPALKLFEDMFEIGEKSHANLQKFFINQSLSSKRFERFARRVRKITNKNLVLKEDSIENLFKIACIDGQLNCAKLDMLEKIAEIIEIPEGNYKVIKKNFEPKFKQENVQDFYEILGVLRNASDAEIKKRWKVLISENHPDLMQAKGVTGDELELCTQKMAVINSAYAAIMKNRKIA